MSSAVLDRVLAIPDYDDRPQMGLSRSGLAAIVERGGITKDGTKAKASVLKRADVKGDRQMTSVIAEKTGTESAKPLDKRAAYEAKYGKKTTSTSTSANTKITQFKDLENAVDEKINSLVTRNGQSGSISPENRDLVKSLYDVKSRLAQIRHHKQEILDLYHEGGEVKSVKQGATNRRYIFKGDEKHSGFKANTSGLEAVSDAFKVLSEKTSAQPKPSAKIAPDTAKKVKRAIAGVKGGKVIKGGKVTTAVNDAWGKNELKK